VTQCKQIWIGAIRKSTIAANPAPIKRAADVAAGPEPRGHNISPYWTAEPRVD
jgi:hypothetical protein